MIKGKVKEGREKRHTNWKNKLMVPPCGDQPEDSGKQERRDPEDKVFEVEEKE